jgi:CheY-like chemotaxis protein
MRRSVLVVDDHAGFRRWARAFLESEGYQVIGEATDGRAAVHEVARLCPDIVLLDVHLPDVDGFEVVRPLDSLAERCPVPTEVAGVPPRRLPAPVEVTIYYLVAEALANVAKHARASRVRVAVDRTDTGVRVEVADDGVGGAAFGAGSGLVGLTDRVAALAGRLDVDSAPGQGTRLRAEIPCGS